MVPASCVAGCRGHIANSPNTSSSISVPLHFTTKTFAIAIAPAWCGCDRLSIDMDNTTARRDVYSGMGRRKVRQENYAFHVCRSRY